jgi:hypothetical protein
MNIWEGLIGIGGDGLFFRGRGTIPSHSCLDESGEANGVVSIFFSQEADKETIMGWIHF